MHGNAPRPPADDELTLAPSDPEAFAKNTTLLAEEMSRIMTILLGSQSPGEVNTLVAQESSQAVKTLANVAEHWLSDPQRVLRAQTELMHGYLDLWERTLRRFGGEEVEPVTEPEPSDRRFKAPEWSEHPLFDFYKQVYLLTSRWAENLVARTDDLDDHTRHKALFYVRQLSAAMAPTNFIATNPELLRETLESNAENLVRGMRMLAEDIEAGHGELKIRQSDNTRFGVGVNLAMTPGKVVYQNDLMQLIQYTPTTDTVLERPLLIVPPWINKFYILDLNPEKSFIRWAVAQGHTVFVVSWVNPDEHQADKSFADYIKEGTLTALNVIGDITKANSVNAIGYCVGGTLLAVTLGYMARKKDTRIASATLLTTQVDFTHAGDLKVFVDEEQLEALEADMAKRGYLEGRRMATAFNMLRANDLIWPYVINNYLKGREPMPFDLLYWNADATRMPAANHSFYLRQCYLTNNLANGKMEIDGEMIDLGKVEIPIYNLATREDHIAPVRSVYLGSKSFGGPVRFVMSGSGHIAGVVNPPEKKKYQFWLNDDLSGTFDDWVAGATETPGSWWPDWHAWIEGHDDARTKARKPGSRKHKPIEDAPGSYVAVRS